MAFFNGTESLTPLDLSCLNLLQGGYQIQSRAYDEILDFNFSDNQNPHPLDLVRKDLDTLEQSFFWDVVVDRLLICVDNIG